MTWTLASRAMWRVASLAGRCDATPIAMVRMIAPSSPVGMPSRSIEITVWVVERLPAEAA